MAPPTTSQHIVALHMVESIFAGAAASPPGAGQGGDPSLVPFCTHQDVELEPVTVLLPGEQHQPLLRVPLSALIQVSPWRVPALVDGGVVPQRWKESSAVRASPRGYHPRYTATPGQKWAFAHSSPCHPTGRSVAGSALRENWESWARVVIACF